MSGARRPVWEPDARELLLLRAGLWPGTRGLDAWREWRRGGGELDDIEAGSQRLLPLVYRNLGKALADDPAAPTLKDAYRRSWTVNQLSLRIGRRAAEAIGEAGVEVMALKGAALLEAAYRDPGARPMGDCDLAVPPDRVGDAVAALRAAGFESSEDDPERRLESRHSLEFRHPDGLEIDLHRRVLWRPGLEDAFWAGAQEGSLGGLAVRILCPADQLVHVCVHGAAWSPLRPIRWVADSYKVLEAADGELDWDRLVRNAEHARLGLPLRDTLGFLRRELDAPIPDEALRALAALPSSAAERRAHAALAHPPSSRRSLAMLWWFWERHRAHAEVDGERPGPAAFVRYMRDFWGLERPSQVPGFAVRRLFRHRA